jgi:exopolyphosphatase/guanosine-5'-triphosphate,3'-diphosphate pyrophosphatase
LVVYEALKRNPTPIFNEKLLCGIGRNLEDTGVLDEAGAQRALAALARFRTITDGLGVGHVVAVATAAVRDAGNGLTFVRDAEKACGFDVKTLSGDEEAALAAEGVLSGIPDATGLAGDLGGGSLELGELFDGQCGRGVSLSVGPLRLVDASAGNTSRAANIAKAAFQTVPWLHEYKGGRLYVVGGIWRALAKIHMAKTDYPLHILQNYEIPRREINQLVELISGLSAKSLEKVEGLSKRRIDALPYGAIVLRELIAATSIERVVVSAFGVREGLLFNLLTDEDRLRDPLIDACKEASLRQARSSTMAAALEEWSGPVFQNEQPRQRRLRRAACLLSDIGWRVHPDYRGSRCYHEVIQMPLAGITHEERLMLAAAIVTRHLGADEARGRREVAELLGEDAYEWANQMGLTLRLGYTLSGSTPALLKQSSLRLDDKTLTLALQEKVDTLSGEIVAKRLSSIAQAMGRDSRIEISKKRAAVATPAVSSV